MRWWCRTCAGATRPRASTSPTGTKGADGYDTIEWAARQPWSSGAVGTFGLSYPGAVQWLAAVERPPSLKAMVPAMTYSTPESFWYSGGVWDGSWLDWTWWNIAPDLRRRLGAPGPRPTTRWPRPGSRTGLRAKAPPADARRCRTSRAWHRGTTSGCATRRAIRGGDWATLEGRYGEVGAAVLNISGWFDEPYGPAGAVDNYRAWCGPAPDSGEAATDPRRLDPRRGGGGPRQGGRPRASARVAAIDYTATVLRWMDRHLKGGGTPAGDGADGPGLRDGGEPVAGARTRGRSRGPRPDTLYLAGGRG